MDLDPIRVETDAFGREYYLNEVTDFASFEPPAAATTNGWYFTHDARDVQCWANEDGREVRYDDPHYIPPTAEEIAAAWEQYVTAHTTNQLLLTNSPRLAGTRSGTTPPTRRCRTGTTP